MSKYLKVKTEFRDEAMFREALEVVCEERRIRFEEHAEATNLIGWQGATRDDVAHYIVRRGYVGHASNDLGFRREDGQVVAVISEYDMRHGGQAILNAVKREYARRKVTEMARRRGLEVEEVHENGAIRLRLVKKSTRRPQRRVRVRR